MYALTICNDNKATVGKMKMALQLCQSLIALKVKIGNKLSLETNEHFLKISIKWLHCELGTGHVSPHFAQMETA